MSATAGTNAVATIKTVLNAGAGPRSPKRLFNGFVPDQWREVALDIDPRTDPDHVGSVNDMRAFFDDAFFDAIWSSHNIEHLHAHEVLPSLREFRRILKPDGFALITCPDLVAVGKLLVAHGLAYKAYDAPAGPITVQDMLFGHGRSIASGSVFMAHNCGFTADHLGTVALQAGFAEVLVGPGSCFDLWALLLMPDADKAALRAFLDPTAAGFLLRQELMTAAESG